MKFRISYRRLIKIILIAVIVLENNFFRLFTIDDNIYIGIYCSIIVIAFCIFLKNKKLMAKCEYVSKLTKRYYACVLLFLFFEFFYTYMKYNDQSLFLFVKNARCYIFLCLIFPIAYLMTEEGDYTPVMDMIMSIVTVSLGLVLVHGIMVNVFQKGFLHPEVYRIVLNREGRMRIWDLSSLEALSCIYAFYAFLYFKNKKKYLISFFVCVMSLVYVEQTRMMLVAITACALFLLVTKECYTRTQQIIKITSVVILFFIATFFIAPAIYDYVQEKMIGHATITVRVLEIAFALEQLKRNPFGLGFISLTMFENNYYTNSVLSLFAMDDIGMLGYTVLVGPWILLLYIIPMIRMFTLLRQCHDNKLKMFLAALYIYLLITAATLFILDKQRFLMWPFCLVLFEYGGRCLEKNKDSQLCQTEK